MEEVCGTGAKEGVKRVKKRIRSPEKWVKNMNKKKRNSGKEYLSSGGHTVAARHSPCDIKCKCQLSCSSLKLEYRRKMFEDFNEMGVYEKQQAYLQRFIHPQLIKRRRHGEYDHPGESRRQHSFHFLALPGGSEVRVCLKTFCDTFGVTARRIQLLAEKILSGKMDHTEKRGGSRSARKIEEWRATILEHIASFPSEIGHYSRQKTESRFLSPDLNVSKMYRAFLEKYCQDYVKPPVSRQWYNQLFLTNFNLSFRVPRVDTCSTCDSLKINIKNSTLNEKRESEMALELHRRRHECATDAMKNDTKNDKQSDSYVLAFDMPQQVYVPQLKHSQMHYSKQLACCNLGIHDSEIDNGFM